MPPTADDHRFARIVAESGMDATAEAVKKLVQQYQRGLLTERDLVRAMWEIDPNEGEIR